VLPWRCDPGTLDDALPAAEIIRTARAVAGQAGAFVSCGGEPLLRTDLCELMAALAQIRPGGLGICTSGRGLDASTVSRLRSAGVQRVHVPFHCARQDAHDWLVGQNGALKTAHRAIRICLEAHLPVVAEIVLTRPTMPHFAETVEVLARTGVRTLWVRRLTAADVDGPQFVSLSPRLSLIQAHLEHAAAVALERRVRMILRDLPLCTAPRLRPLFATPDSEMWVMPDGTLQARVARSLGCATCPGWPRCGGAPQDYVSRFGWEEFTVPELSAPRVAESVREQQADRSSAPMRFSWRGPCRVQCQACADPRGDESDASKPVEPTRVVRARLVVAARYRPAVLHLMGADLLAHPQAAFLLYDALRLFRRVEVAGEASPVANWSDLDLRRLKGLQRFDVAVYGADARAHDAHCGIPGAFAAMQRAVEQLRAKTEVPVGSYAIIHDAREISPLVIAWERGELPGEPRFRLSARGGCLDELVECARALPPGPARSALMAVLPRCICEQEGLEAVESGETGGTLSFFEPQQRIQSGRSLTAEPGGSDPIGAFGPCPEGRTSCAASGCAGAAVGWHRTARSRQWMASL
jgi:MoaA/NifB/PqqE/SkfB family radical SAM enzyme